MPGVPHPRPLRGHPLPEGEGIKSLCADVAQGGDEGVYLLLRVHLGHAEEHGVRDAPVGVSLTLALSRGERGI